MGIPDSYLLDLIGKVRSWISWGTSDSNSISCGFEMTDINCTSCCHCNNSMLDSSIKCKCESCGRLLCGDCVQGLASMNFVSTGILKETMETVFRINSCQFCSELRPRGQNVRRCSGKVYPSESPRQSPEPPSPSFSGEEFDGQEDDAEAVYEHFRKMNPNDFAGTTNPLAAERWIKSLEIICDLMQLGDADRVRHK